jgi:hypothetical protein
MLRQCAPLLALTSIVDLAYSFYAAIPDFAG